ncbi:MAG: glycosyl hydrolase family 95 catalytic domain-containing protein [Faecousia sp.]
MTTRMPPKYCDLVFSHAIRRWDEALPLGNGKIGALVWGAPEKLIFSLDRTDIWDNTPFPGVKSGEYTYENMVRLARAGDEEGVRRVFDTPYQMVTPCKLPAGRLVLQLPESEIIHSRLALAQATAHVYMGQVKLESFLHARQNIGLIRLNIPSQAFSFEIENPDFGTEGEDNSRAPSGSLKQLRYPLPEKHGDGLCKWYIQRAGGDFSYGVFARAADTVDGCLVAFTVADSHDGPNWKEKAMASLTAALDTGYEALLGEHLAWWREFWKKSGVVLPDRDFEKNWYLTNYLLAACSRKGGFPMPLQGVWTADEGTLPPWKGDYHHDLNTQLSYSHYLKANHLEEGACFLDFLWSLRGVGRDFARDFYGCRDGLCLPAVMSIDGQSLGGWGMYSLSPTNQIWLCQLFERHYRYTGDKTFLRERAYPYLEETAKCILSLLEERDGMLYLPISSSPEIHDDRIQAFLTPNSNYDLALMRWLFARLSELAPEVESPNGQRWRAVLDKLPQLAVTERGVLMLSPDEAIAVSHRHHAHLLAIHPLRLVDYDTQEGQRIIDASIEDLEVRGPGQWCGYSYAWAAELYAIQRCGNGAQRALQIFWEDFCSPNGFHLNGDYHRRGSSSMHYRPFTLEGNMCAASALQEMLLQSEKGVLRLFPALPEEWMEKRVSFASFRTEGGVLVSAEYSHGTVTRLTLEHVKGKKVRLAAGEALAPMAAALGWQLENGCYQIVCEQQTGRFCLPKQQEARL